MNNITYKLEMDAVSTHPVLQPWLLVSLHRGAFWFILTE